MTRLHNISVLDVIRDGLSFPVAGVWPAVWEARKTTSYLCTNHTQRDSSIFHLHVRLIRVLQQTIMMNRVKSVASAQSARPVESVYQQKVNTVCLKSINVDMVLHESLTVPLVLADIVVNACV